MLSLDGGPSCNFVVLQSPLLDRDQHFGLWYFLTSERVSPTYEMQNVCRLYQATADLGSMWEAARILWFISIIPCFVMTFALWRMLITPISKSSWVSYFVLVLKSYYASNDLLHFSTFNAHQHHMNRQS